MPRLGFFWNLLPCTIVGVFHGQSPSENTSPFENFIQVIEGPAEIVIIGQLNVLDTGQSIIVPGHYNNIIKARGSKSFMQ
ncbi:hypothetical protein SAMN03097699_0782 [Flavobacteriaceae bacterium MAR_2010_188]|nr:hypothetical protein SAMN03097699_0782 [Flavobacteriaceae bacterium MAR_2010_188]